MKVYALIATIGNTDSFSCETRAVTHAASLEMACRKFRVTPVPEGKGYWRERIVQRLPVPPKAEAPEFVQVTATDDSAAEVGHVLSIPSLHGFMINAGVWVCELPVID